jgi:hypothetical protein
VPAVNGAVSRDDRKTSVGIAADQPRNGHVPLLTERILNPSQREIEFPGVGKTLKA